MAAPGHPTETFLAVSLFIQGLKCEFDSQITMQMHFFWSIDHWFWDWLFPQQHTAKAGKTLFSQASRPNLGPQSTLNKIKQCNVFFLFCFFNQWAPRNKNDRCSTWMTNKELRKTHGSTSWSHDQKKIAKLDKDSQEEELNKKTKMLVIGTYFVLKKRTVPQSDWVKRILDSYLTQISLFIRLELHFFSVHLRKIVRVRHILSARDAYIIIHAPIAAKYCFWFFPR